MLCAKLDFDRLVRVLGKRFRHFSIENEGRIGVELVLELEKLGFPAGPRARLIHREHKGFAARVVSERVQDTRVGDSFWRYALGNHR